jgi:hypothetical protein
MILGTLLHIALDAPDISRILESRLHSNETIRLSSRLEMKTSSILI